VEKRAMIAASVDRAAHSGKCGMEVVVRLKCLVGNLGACHSRRRNVE